MTATATFQDCYFGATEMVLEVFRTKVRGERVARCRWVKGPEADGCITTGFNSHGFASQAAAVAAARRHANFSNVKG